MTYGRTAILAGIALCAILSLSPPSALAAENTCGPMTPAEEQLLRLQTENEQLLARLKQLDGSRGIPQERLLEKKAQRLKGIAADVRLQRQTTADFEGFFKWMSSNLAGYNRYIQAGSYAALIARVLPIPYAGQASVFTKFLAQFTIALNNASVSVTSYQTSSKRFLEMVEALDRSTPPNDKALAEAAAFADSQLLKDMNEAQARLTSVSELSAGALSFLEALHGYASSTDEYWNKARGIFRKDVDPKEKSFLSESIAGLKARADQFNLRFRNFEELGRRETAGVRTLTVFDELLADAAAAR